MIRNKSYIFSGDMQDITEILDGKTFHQFSRIDEFYRLKFGDTCITLKNIRFISYITEYKIYFSSFNFILQQQNNIH